MSETTTTTTRKSRTVAPSPRIAIVDLTPNNVGTLRKLNSVLFPVSYSDKFYHQVLDEYLSDYCKLIYYNDLPVGAVCCRIEPDPREHHAAATGKANGAAPNQTNGASNATKLYIMTLGVLAPYRQQGLATKLLNQVISAAQKTHQSVASTSQTNGEGITKSTSTTTTTTTLTTSSSAAIESSSSKKSAQKGKKSTVKKTAETGEVGANLVVGTTTTTTRAQGENEEEPSSVRVPLISSAYVHVQFGNEEAKQFYRNRGFSLDGEVSEYYRKIEPRGAWILVKQVAA